MNYISLFSGMECAHLAWKPLGWTCKAVAEIDPRACEVLAHRLNASQPKYLPPFTPVWVVEIDDEGNDLPGKWSTDPFPRKAYAHLPPFGTPGTLPNFGDVSQITEDDIKALGPLDVEIGGSPCQDLSVAGKRAGLVGARSSLFHQQLRIFHAARTFCGCRFLAWENVPGAFSSNKGRDFAVVVGALAGCELTVPRDGWGTEGMALGENGLVEWCVLDAQWFGVAQRRRRVFAVLDTGDWSSRPPILLEPESLRGDSAPRRETGQTVAPTIAARTRGGGGLGTDFDCDGGLIAMGSGQAGAEVITDGGAPTLTCLHEAPIVYGSFMQDTASTLLKGGHGNNPLDETLIPTTAHTLRGDGFDASEDGIGGLAPAECPNCGEEQAVAHVPIQDGPVAFNNTGAGFWNEAGAAATVRKGDDQGGGAARESTLIAFSCKDFAADAADDLSPTLRSMGHEGSHANGGGQVAVAFSPQAAGKQTTLGYDQDVDTAPTLSVCTTPAAQVGMAVRRLTPRECERLQLGLGHDDYTLVPSGPKGKPMADGPRYKMLGNSFARPVITWIGRQIMRATEQSREA